jgi:hypothetical protein
MWRWPDLRYAEINSLSRTYLSAGCFEEKVCVLDEMSKAILRSCEPSNNNHASATVALHESIPSMALNTAS